MVSLDADFDSQRLLWVKTVTCLGLACGLIYTRKLWCSGSARTCPRVPLFSGLPQLRHESLLYLALLLLLVAVAVRPQPGLSIAAFVTLAMVLSLADWTRFRPWLYQDIFFLIAMAACYWQGGESPAQDEALHICRLILVSVYFWSGLLKINQCFFKSAFPSIVGPLATRLPLPLGAMLRDLGYAAGFLEAAMALGLLFPSTRTVSLLGLLVMHLFILACFSPIGHQGFRAIWPWNISMLVIDFIVFWNTDEVLWSDILWGNGSALHWLVLFQFTLLPVLGLFNLLDPVFSHGHMTGRHVSCQILINHRLFGQLPLAWQSAFQRVDTGRGVLYLLVVQQWTMDELRVPAVQQERLLCRLTRGLSRFGAGPGEVTLTVFRMPGFRALEPPYKIYSWEELTSVSSQGRG